MTAKEFQERFDKHYRERLSPGKKTPRFDNKKVDVVPKEMVKPVKV